jgi:hypothetical protein
MEDDLLFPKMEEVLNFSKMAQNLIFLEMKNDLNFLILGLPQFFKSEWRPQWKLFPPFNIKWTVTRNTFPFNLHS